MLLRSLVRKLGTVCFDAKLHSGIHIAAFGSRVAAPLLGILLEPLAPLLFGLRASLLSHRDLHQY